MITKDDKLEYGETINDKEAGCDYTEVLNGDATGKVKICHVRVTDIKNIAIELITDVQNTSWMMELDKGTRRSYERTVSETADALVKIFENVVDGGNVGSDFGELMVSMGSAKALGFVFDHMVLPIAELWKPQLKQNEGFDFHTVCESMFINFGEAKYSSYGSPYDDAVSQASGFVEKEKHLRDRVHLISLVSGDAIANLDDDRIGVIAAFSINAMNPLVVLKHALATATAELSAKSIQNVYLVGVSR